MREEGWAHIALESSSPSERLRAATWAKAHPAAMNAGTLMRALQNEPVPQIRQILNDTLAVRQLERLVGSGEPSSAVPDLARLLRHELSPPIGWIRRAGTREIPEFQRSSTNDAINRLERRIDALISLIKSDAALEISECNLETILRDVWPDFSDDPHFSPAPDLSGRAVILRTDVGLLELLLANAYQNAIDARIEVQDAPPIGIAWGEARGRFWVRISNAFSGTQFDIEDVEATGISTKVGHQGVGIALIKSATERMGYGFRVAGSSGMATFTLTGGTQVA